MISTQLKELLLQHLTCGRGGVLVYRTALAAVRDRNLRQEWHRHLQQSERYVSILERLIGALGFDPEELTPSCRVVAHLGKALVRGIHIAISEADAIAPNLPPARRCCSPRPRIRRAVKC